MLVAPANVSAEFIQWNWKVIYLDTLEQYSIIPESIQWNWKTNPDFWNEVDVEQARIHSMDIESRLYLHPGIHLMELDEGLTV